jgi:hypothetical protein
MDLTKLYKGFDDEKIERLALYEVEDLSNTAVDLLKKEIVCRNLNPRLIEVIDAQLKGISVDEFFEYSKLLLNLPCPVCGKRGGNLDITRKGQVVSVVFFTGYDQVLICGCKDCLRKMIKRSLTVSLIFGWWGFPLGPIRTIQSIIFNIKRLKETRTEMQSEDFLKFAYANKGYIMAYVDSESDLLGLISEINKNS